MLERGNVYHILAHVVNSKAFKYPFCLFLPVFRLVLPILSILSRWDMSMERGPDCGSKHGRDDNSFGWEQVMMMMMMMDDNNDDDDDDDG